MTSYVDVDSFLDVVFFDLFSFDEDDIFSFDVSFDEDIFLVFFVEGCTDPSFCLKVRSSSLHGLHL